MSPGRESDSHPRPPARSEYSTVSLRSVWGIVSIMLFVMSMTTRQLLFLLPPQSRGYYLMPPLTIRLIPVLAILGILFGLVGLHRERRRTLALLGLGLNVIVLLLTTAFIVGFWWVRLR